MPRPLGESVVVITGASSGIGRATARRLAKRGASLALCARSRDPLRDVADECRDAGARGVLSKALDVAEEEAVDAFARDAVAGLGRIDVWVNNAAVIAYGWRPGPGRSRALPGGRRPRADEVRLPPGEVRD